MHRLVASAWFGVLFGLVPMLAHNILGCAIDRCRFIERGLELGLIYAITGGAAWLLFAGSTRHFWTRSLIIGFLASAFAPGVQWLWIWSLMPADAPHGMGMISAWTYLLMVTVPIMTLIAVGAARLVQRRHAAAHPPEANCPRRLSIEAAGYGMAVGGAILLLAVTLPGGLTLEAADEAMFWSAAFLAPPLVWLGIFWRAPSMDFAGVALAIVACPVVIMLVSIAWWRDGIADRYQGIVWLPGYVFHLGWLNLLDLGPLMMPTLAALTLGYRQFALWRRMKGNRLTVESARDSFGP